MYSVFSIYSVFFSIFLISNEYNGFSSTDLKNGYPLLNLMLKSFFNQFFKLINIHKFDFSRLNTNKPSICTSPRILILEC